MVRSDSDVFACAQKSQASVTTCDALRGSERRDKNALSCAADTLRCEIEKAQMRAARFVELDLDKTYWRTLKRHAPREWIRQRRAMNVERAAIQRQGLALNRRLQQIKNALHFQATAQCRQHGAYSRSTLSAHDTIQPDFTRLPANNTTPRQWTEILPFGSTGTSRARSN